jgi:hypothetical protein
MGRILDRIMEIYIYISLGLVASYSKYREAFVSYKVIQNHRREFKGMCHRT